MNEQELRELDAHIAEKVFGWKWWHFKMGDQEWSELVDPLCTWPKTRKQYNGNLVENRPIGIEDCTSAPHYSTDRAASQEVLERCIEKTPHTICSGNLTFPKRFVVFLGGTYEQTKQEAETLPLAICLFAKKLFSK